MEVAGSAERLSAMIDKGDIPRPELMAFNQWLRWRSTTGRRPLLKRDGEFTSMEKESELWKATMQYLYGDDWAMERSPLSIKSKENPTGNFTHLKKLR